MNLGLFKKNDLLKQKSNIISFCANSEKPKYKRLPIEREFADKIIGAAKASDTSITEYLKQYLPHLINAAKGVIPVPSVTASVGQTNVTTLIDSKQIFQKIIEDIKNAKDSIQVEMFEFQNMKVDGDRWPSKGAELVPGWNEQQQILDMLINKKLTNPNIKIQVILDSHKSYSDGNNNKAKYYANDKMTKYLLENGIDVVPYPRPKNGGTILQHIKFFAVDGKKVLLGGMNWGNHSVVNHDACVYIENKPNCEHSEVDNIISEIFHNDWNFAWQKLSKTIMANIPLDTKAPSGSNNKKDEVQQEDIDYINLVGKLYNDPKYINRYRDNRLDLPENISPVNNPIVKIMTNTPRDYASINKTGSESIGDYIKQRLETTTSLRAELFVLTHKEVVNKIIQRYKEAQNGGRPFDVKILVSPDIIEKFPYCPKAYYDLEEAGVPVRTYNINKDLEQRLHTKWAVFDNKELLIGSANWSALGLENNIQTGQRPDYPYTNSLIDESILKYKARVDEIEKDLKIPSIFDKDNKINLKELKKRISQIKAQLKDANSISSVEVRSVKELTGIYRNIIVECANKNLKLKTIFDELPKETQERVTKLETDLKLKTLFNDKNTPKDLQTRVNDIEKKLTNLEKFEVDETIVTFDKVKDLKTLLGYYQLLKAQEDKRPKYKRGNHECAVLVPNNKIANTFIKQFDKDWDFSKPILPDGYVVNDVVDDDNIELKLVSFTGKRCSFNKIV